MTLAPDFFQFRIDETAEVTGKRHQRMGPGAELVQAQGTGHGVGAQQFRLAAAQHLALGVGRQVGGVADTDGDLP
ncbi:hypothetical protein D3C76_1363410 [compost metagenome]